MNKDITVDSISDPDVPPYQDTISVGDCSVPCSATPDAYEIDDTKTDKRGKPWDQVFGWVACGSYPYAVIDSPKHGKCISINNGGQVPTRNPDYTNGGAMYATAVEVHCGFSAHWQGSRACITVHPDHWAEFISQFELGDTGTITIQEVA